ncbi:hypothetical protein TIFTF001_014113 [Ficus carica]|uniref:Uncharacterized protein n=1 Tax=Ficus carica TaxID=3494 RepID=A0AA88A360_FICCA|nr:hypothetical protein TIFTF001_014113 [Ficus carica]
MHCGEQRQLYKVLVKVEEEKSVQGGDIASDETEEPMSEDELVVWTKCIAENEGNYTKCWAKVEEDMLVQDDVASSEPEKPMSEGELQVWTNALLRTRATLPNAGPWLRNSNLV